MMKKLSKDDSGIIQIIYIAVLLGVAIAAGSITIFITDTVVGITGTPTGALPTNATGTVTFSGNVSNGTAVNITDTSGFKYVFEFNLSGRGSNAAETCYVFRTEPGCIPVNASFAMGWNSSTYSAGNLTRVMNTNSTVSANITATNTTTVVSITADTAGSAGNSMTLTSTGSGITVSGLSGGTDASASGQRLNNASNNLMDTMETGYSFLPIVAIAAIGAIAIGFVFGLIPGRKQSGGGGMI